MHNPSSHLAVPAPVTTAGDDAHAVLADWHAYAARAHLGPEVAEAESGASLRGHAVRLSVALAAALAELDALETLGDELAELLAVSDACRPSRPHARPGPAGGRRDG